MPNYAFKINWGQTPINYDLNSQANVRSVNWGLTPINFRIASC